MNENLTKNIIAPPFVYTRPTVLKTNLFIISLLCVQIMVLAFTKDFFSILNIFCACLGCICVDMFTQYNFFQKLKFNIEVITIGLLIGFFMPYNIGFIFVFIVSAISFFITRIVFGGTGSNWVNPVALAICIAYISRADFFPIIITKDMIIQNNGSVFLALQKLSFLKLKIDFSVTSALNSIFLHRVGVTLPEGYVTLFMNSTSVIPAFRYNLITIISSIILFSFRMIDYIIPFLFLIVYSFLIWIFGSVSYTGELFKGDILVALLTGGILFSVIFIVSESSSNPKTVWGKILLGFIMGVFSFFMCKQSVCSIGFVFIIVITNLISPIIERIEIIVQKKKRFIYE